MKMKPHDISVNLLMILLSMFACAATTHAEIPWDHAQEVNAADQSSFARFGSSVAINGNLAVIGAPDDGEFGPHAGSAYVIEVNTGRQLLKLQPSDGSAFDYFGSAVAISNRFIVIGAPFHNKRQINSGSAYVFNAATGRQLFQLRAADGAEGDSFGCSVAIDGKFAVIGAPDKTNNGINSGSAYIFDITTGKQLRKLNATDADHENRFGDSVAIDGNLALIGADGNGSKHGPSSGSAYIFNINTGRQLFKLRPQDGSPGDQFGLSVALSGNRAIVGAHLYNDNNSSTIPGCGVAFIFNTTTGRQLSKLRAADNADNDSFGISVAISGNLALIGSSGDDDLGSVSGSAYLFDVSTGRQLTKLFAPDGSAADRFGLSVAIHDGILVIGANGHDHQGASSSGSVYIFQQESPASFGSQLAIAPIPLISEQISTFSIMQAIPRKRTWLLYSLDGLQPSFVRKLNIVIDIANPKLVVRPRRTDAEGNLQWVLIMPETMQPLTIWFQAVQKRNTTNYITTQFVP